jgi:acyl-[acyl-carrier-protein] desaturase
MISSTIPEQRYRICLDFLETAENKRRWNIFNDIPWDKLDVSKATDEVVQRVEVFCAEEMYVPDFISKGISLTRPSVGATWFQIRWAYEESNHGLAFREYLSRSGLRSEAELEAVEHESFSREWQLPFQTLRQMLCYGAFQEGATYTSYNVQRARARSAGDEVLETIFYLVGRDEAAHAGFYRSMVQLELAEDREGTIADLVHVLSNFKMPGDGLIPNYVQRHESSGAALGHRVFIQRVALPLLNTLNINRDELRSMLKQGSLAIGA